MKILLLLVLTITATAQEIPIVQYSCFCEGNGGLGDPGSYRERIKQVGRIDGGNYTCTAILVRDCGQPIFPIKAIKKNDTLFVSTGQIANMEVNLVNGTKRLRKYIPEECYCAYEFRIEVAIDTISVISIDNKILEKTDEKFVTQPIRYFLFNGDTTGYEDKYGRRQGYYVIKRKNDLLKSVYKDGILVSCELLSLDGSLIRKEKDCYPFIDLKRK